MKNLWGEKTKNKPSSDNKNSLITNISMVSFLLVVLNFKVKFKTVVLWFYLVLGKMTPKIESKKIEQTRSQHFASYFPRAPAATYVFVAKE